jgi:hypothetical protein
MFDAHTNLSLLAIDAKKSSFVKMSLLWKPFESRFEEILEDFSYHADAVKTELLIAQLSETTTGREVLASQIQELKDQMRFAEKRQADLEKSVKEATIEVLKSRQKGINGAIAVGLSSANCVQIVCCSRLIVYVVGSQPLRLDKSMKKLWRKGSPGLLNGSLMNPSLPIGLLDLSRLQPAPLVSMIVLSGSKASLAT